MSMNKVFGAITKGTTETVRSLAATSLASGVPVDVGTSILPKTKEITIAGSDNFQSTGTNQSERAQVEPSTTNKVPRIYGNVITGGVVIDAQKSGANTVFVAMALSVTDPTGYDQVINNFDGTDLGPPWGLYEIYRGNQTCEMQSNVFTMGNAESYGYTASTVQVLSDIADPSNNTDISTANVINVWAWQHEANTTNQIFPYYPPASTFRQNIWDIMPGWSNTDTCKGLVTVLVEVDLDESLDIKEFGNFKFKIGTRGYYEKDAEGGENTQYLTNPSYALQDYLAHLGYGEFALDTVIFDSTSFADWAAYCDETYYYAVPTGDTDVIGGTLYNTYGSYDVYTTTRWQINGFINTQKPLRENIDAIAQAGQGSLTYDNRAGKFRLLINKPITNAEGANCFVFDNNNIISGVQYNSTDLYSLYNYADATFPNTLQQDLADTVIVKTPASDQAQNELPSGMNFQVDTVNDRPRASQMANNSLKASRVANMASFEADYSTFEVEVGDFVKVTESGKGWNEKLFKVMRITESQDDDGTATLAYSCLEHRPSTYEDIIYVNTASEPFANGVGTAENLTVSNVLSFTDQFGSFTPTLEAFVIADDPASGNANVFHANGTLNYNDTISNVLNNFGYTSSKANVYVDYANESWFMVSANTAGDPAFTNGKLTAVKVQNFVNDYSTPAYDSTASTVTYESGATPDNANIHNVFMPINKLANGNYEFEYNFYKQEAVRQRPSVTVDVGNILIADQWATGSALFDDFGPGTFLTQSATATVDPGSSNIQVLSSTSHKIIDINQNNDFDLTYNFTPTWTSITIFTDDVAFGLAGNITFVNASNNSSKVFPISGGGIQYDNITGTEAVNANNTQFTYTVQMSGRAEYYGLDRNEWYPATANVNFIGYNSAPGGAFNNVSYTLSTIDPLYRS